MYEFKQTRILSKFGDDHWYENILGRLIEPVTRKYEKGLKSFWFSRYEWPAYDLYNLQEKDVPVDFIQNSMTRSVEFRITIYKDILTEFQQEFKTLVKDLGYFAIDFEPYQLHNLLTGPANFSDPIFDDKKKERCAIVDDLYFQISRVTLHALATSDGKNFKFEEVSSKAAEHQRPSPFANVHHLFCNITQVPLNVAIGINYDLTSNLSLTTKTGWSYTGTYPPAGVSGHWPVPIVTEINMHVYFG